jgi:hypothetical protein
MGPPPHPLHPPGPWRVEENKISKGRFHYVKKYEKGGREQRGKCQRKKEKAKDMGKFKLKR